MDMADVRATDDTPASSGSIVQGGWKTRDFIVTAAIAVVLGLVWSLGWVHVWQIARGILPEFGFFVAGFYVAAAVITGYIIRRPGAALLGEMIAAIIEVPLTALGPVALILGLLQGLGVEAVFAATRYRNWSLPVLLLAGALGAALGYAYEMFAFGYINMEPLAQATRFGARELGGIILAGLLGKLIADALAQTGVLNNFPIARDRVREV
jgi:energy-coupling factor transport system permease protein